ncbi:superoxide dismutase [Candidatus Nomurabacteria bacterium]|nr:superoxide dismutase [Candidatus Nomurabacteria bacterium]MCB9820856.1 superoxide dismutase [Candidatus Nomurabacteria bacterium]
MFTAKTFNIGKLKGISEKTIEEHIGLYNGYVKNANSIIDMMSKLDSEKDAYITAELFRRFSFEYNGMRNHEIYFSSLEGGSKAFDPESALGKRLMELFGSYEKFVKEFSALAMTRGVGWAVLWYDKKEDKFLASWVDEQHLGHLNGADMILALDMWEHSFVADYQPSGKKQYIADFFENLNWKVIENNFTEVSTK